MAAALILLGHKLKLKVYILTSDECEHTFWIALEPEYETSRRKCCIRHCFISLLRVNLSVLQHYINNPLHRLAVNLLSSTDRIINPARSASTMNSLSSESAPTNSHQSETSTYSCISKKQTLLNSHLQYQKHIFSFIWHVLKPTLV